MSLRCLFGGHSPGEPIAFWRSRGAEGTTYQCSRCPALIDVEYDETGFRLGLPVQERDEEGKT